MRKGYLTLAVVVLVLTVVMAAAVILIERGIAFQSETDSEDNIEAPQYVKAHTLDGEMVSIPSVVYTMSEDKESYVLSNNVQSVQGVLDVKTKNDHPMTLKTVVTFQEPGTWMLVETMDFVTQKHLGFTIMVCTESTLPALTVLTIDSEGEVSKCVNGVTEVPGSWKVWGVGHETIEKYTVHSSDAFKGFILLVDSSFNLTHLYNVIKISGTEGHEECVLDTSATTIGSEVDLDSKSWRVWNTGSVITQYHLIEGDLVNYTDDQHAVRIYDYTAAVSGRSTPSLTVVTGEYDFMININYRYQLKVEPFEYEGENMVSNVMFVLSDKLTVSFNANGGSGAMTDQFIDYNTAATLKQQTLTPPTDKVFAHWNTEKDDTGDSYNNGASITSTRDVTLYAIWTDPAP